MVATKITGKEKFRYFIDKSSKRAKVRDSRQVPGLCTLKQIIEVPAISKTAREGSPYKWYFINERPDLSESV